MKDIELSKVSLYRGQLMGFAIIIVALFHVGLPRDSYGYGLMRMGNLGVDIFFFLSGIGLWYSWTKSQDLKRFYLNRLTRIYPAWLIIAGTYYIINYKHTGMDSLMDLTGDILINWDFWLNDELTFWYVPATMMMYLFAPFYMNLIRMNPIYRWLIVLPLMWCIIQQYVIPVHDAIGHIEIFWSRIPVFLLGINCGESIRSKQVIDRTAWPMVFVLFAVSLSACIWLEQMIHGKFPLYTERMLYIVLAVTSIIIFSELFSHIPSWLSKALTFVGGISLEIYLIHIEFVLKPVKTLGLGYWPNFLIMMLISIPAAWMVSRVCKRLLKIL